MRSTITTKRCATPCSSRATWSTRLAEKFVGMYVNHYTVDAGEMIPKAAQKLLDMGYEAGLIPQARRSRIRHDRARPTGLLA